MSKRAERRHHYNRLRAKRGKYTMIGESTPKRLGMAVHTACACSCWMCGNPRRHSGERTIQERKHEL